MQACSPRPFCARSRHENYVNTTSFTKSTTLVVTTPGIEQPTQTNDAPPVTGRQSSQIEMRGLSR